MNISYKTFLFIIISYTLLTAYILSISFRYPFVGIEVERVHDDWVIESFDFPEWAELYGIERGDRVLQVDNKTLKVENDSAQYKIKSAKTILIKDKQGNSVSISVKHSDLPSQFLNFFIIPFVYWLISLMICIYLYVYKRTTFQSLHIFILFILTVSLTYSSVGASSRSHSFGVFIVSNGLIANIVLLIHFLNNYFQTFNIKPFLIIKQSVLYGLMSIICLLTILEVNIYFIQSFNTKLLLVTFCMLVFYAIFMLMMAYIKYRKQQFLLLFLCFIVPLLPMVFLYMLPMLLFNQFILESSICLLFLLCIPILLLLLQLPERLFDLGYQISKLRYYSFLSLILSTLICLGMYVVASVNLKQMLISFLYIFIVIVVALYFKEKVDYSNRKLLYSPKGDYIHLVYKTIEQVNKVLTVDELISRFTEELSQQLAISDVHVYYYAILDQTMEKKDELPDLIIPPDIIEQLRLGEIKKKGNIYITCLHQTLEKKYILTLEDKHGTHLKKEEILCLELLIMYINNFIENTQLVEGLINQLNTSQKLDNQYPSWLKKFVWIQVENEKYELAQELHDTILQQQIHLIRELDRIQVRKEPKEIQQSIQQQRENLIELNQQLRIYCEQLKPPLLDKQGLQVALERLIIETDERADFSIIADIEEIVLENRELPLLIYRTIQELLNNAMKHSKATYVKIQLMPKEYGFKLVYFDNGVGCDLQQNALKKSMGLQGIKERIHAYNGSIHMESAPDEGMRIYIKMEEEKFDD